MCVQLELMTGYDPHVKDHVPIVTLYAVIMFKGHASFYSEWTLDYWNMHLFINTLIFSYGSFTWSFWKLVPDVILWYDQADYVRCQRYLNFYSVITENIKIYSYFTAAYLCHQYINHNNATHCTSGFAVPQCSSQWWGANIRALPQQRCSVKCEQGAWHENFEK